MNALHARLELDVVRGKQVEVAISVVVEEHGTTAPARIPRSGPLRHVLEGSVSAVPVQSVGAVVGDVEIREAVSVEVATGTALAVGRGGEARGIGHVRKGAYILRPVLTGLFVYDFDRDVSLKIKIFVEDLDL